MIGFWCTLIHPFVENFLAFFEATYLGFLLSMEWISIAVCNLVGAFI